MKNIRSYSGGVQNERSLYYSGREKKCQKVADAFAELYEIENILVMDAGRYGFVKLQYYSKQRGFENVFTFVDSKSLFDDLWQEWFDTKLILRARETPMQEMDYEEIFNCLSEQEKNELLDRKTEFAKAAEIELNITE